MKNRALGGLIIILAALVIIYLAATWYVGNISQQKLTTYIDQINQELADQWSGENAPEIKIIDYKKGLSSSLITYQINYQLEQADPEQILLVDKLSHGPFPFAAFSQGDFTPMLAYSQIKPMHKGIMQSWFNLMSGDDLPWQMTNKYYFTGAVNSDLVLNKFADPDRNLEFKGGHVYSDYQPATGNFESTASLPSLSFIETASKTLFQLQNVDVKVLTTKDKQANLQSHQQIQLDKIKASWSDGLSITLEKPSFTIDSAYKDKLANNKINYDLGQVIVGDNQIGNLQAILSTENINTAVLQEIINIFANTADNDLLLIAKPEVEKELKQLLEKFFASAPIFSLDNLQWQTAKASSNLKSKVAFKPIETAQFDDIEVLLEHAIDQFQLDLILVKPMIIEVLKTQFDDRSVQLFSMLFDHYAARANRLGLLLITEQGLHSNINYADNVLSLNGKSLSMSELQERLGSIISP